MPCDCIARVNEQLAALNAALDVPLSIDMKTGQTQPPKLTVAVCKRDTKKRGRLPVLFASYCPFCGVAYTEKTEEVPP